MYRIKYSGHYKRDLKNILKRNYDLKELNDVVNLLVNGTKLPAKYRDHMLFGDYQGCRECHILPNWLLIYIIYKQQNMLFLLRTGSHADLF